MGTQGKKNHEKNSWSHKIRGWLLEKKIKRWKPIAKRPTGRPKLRWEDDVLEDIKNMNVHNWKKLAQDRERWKKVVTASVV